MAAIQYLHLDMVAGGMQCCNERHQMEIQGVKCLCGAMSCENIGTKSNSGRDNMNGYLVHCIDAHSAHIGLGNVAIMLKHL